MRSARDRSAPPRRQHGEQRPGQHHGPLPSLPHANRWKAREAEGPTATASAQDHGPVLRVWTLHRPSDQGPVSDVLHAFLPCSMGREASPETARDSVCIASRTGPGRRHRGRRRAWPASPLGGRPDGRAARSGRRHDHHARALPASSRCASAASRRSLRSRAAAVALGELEHTGRSDCRAPRAGRSADHSRQRR